MTRRGLILGALVLGGLGYGATRLPALRRFVRTVREQAHEREAELREAVEVAVRTDATSRAPRHAPGSTVPDLDVDAGWDTDRRHTPSGPVGDPGRSLSREEARAILRDPTGHSARAAPATPPGPRAR